MTTTKTVRIYEDDFERAKMLALVWFGTTPANIFRMALNEFFEHHRAEMDAKLAHVQDAVLSGSRQKMHDLFLENVAAQVQTSAEAIHKLVESDAQIEVR
jgi:hypothetical protein